MKCTLSASALLVALASLFPVAAAETPATNHQVEAVAQFNEYLNAGEIEQAEALAKECFLKNSSDPVAVLMLRQAFLARKGHPQQVVFPGRLTRSKVIATQQPADTADALQESGVVARSAKTAVVHSRAKVIAPGTTSGLAIGSAVSDSRVNGTQPSLLAGAIFSSQISESGNNLLRPITTADHHVGKQPPAVVNTEFTRELIVSATKSCAGGCLEPLNAAVAISTGTHPILPPHTSRRKLASSSYFEPSKGLLVSSNHGQKSKVRVLVLDNAEQGAGDQIETEATTHLTLHLIKGPISTLDRLGIAVEGEGAPKISQPKLNAATNALPTPITVPVLVPADEDRYDHSQGLLARLLNSNPVTFDCDLANVGEDTDNVIRNATEALATRRLSRGERDEVLKAAMAAKGVSFTTLPHLTMSNKQDVDLSSSVLDSAGKALELAIHSDITPDQRSTILKLSFHSEQGPAALSQRVTIADLLESDAALLIALDAPVSTPDSGVTDPQRQTTYLVVSPSIVVKSSGKATEAKTASYQTESGQTFEPGQIIRTHSQSAAGKLRTKVYAVADLIVPIPAEVTAAANREDILRGTERNIQNLMASLRKFDAQAWAEQGGDCQMTASSETLSLVVNAPEAIHQQIAERLSKLREELDIQAVVEAIYLSGDAESLSQAGIVITQQDALLSNAEMNSRKPTTHKPKSATTSKDCPANGSALSATIQGSFQIQTVGHEECAKDLAQPAAVCPETMVLRASVQTDCPLQTAVQSAVNFIQFGPTVMKLALLGESPSCCEETAKESAVPQFKLLTAAQHDFLIQTAQASPRCNIMCAPKITMFNDQIATIQANGLSLRVGAGISQDRQTVNLRLATGETNADCQESAQTTFEGPLRAGESILLPLASAGCDGDAGCKAEKRFVLITPRVIVAGEKTETPAKSPIE